MAKGTPQGATVSANFRFAPEVKDLLERAANAANMTMTDWLTRAIEEQAKREGIE